MKPMKYTLAALFLGVVLSTSPAFATANADSGAKASSSTDSQVESQEPQQNIEQTREKAEAARKQVVAKVNGVDIYMYDLVGMMNRVAKAYYSHVKEPTDEITREIKQRALDRLIFEELAVKEAEKQGIEPKPEDVQKVIDQLKQAYGTEEGFQGYLDGIGLSEDGLRARIVRSRRLEGITGREVYQKVIRKEDVIEKAYEQYKKEGKLKKADEFLVKEILVMDAGDEKATRERAEELLAVLKKNNNDFGKLVLDGTFIVRRMPIKKDKYPVVFATMQEMEVGQFSGVVEDNDSFHIFEVLQNDLARDMTVEEARGFIEDRLAPYFQEERRTEWINELRKDAKIEILDEDLRGILTKKSEETE